MAACDASRRPRRRGSIYLIGSEAIRVPADVRGSTNLEWHHSPLAYVSVLVCIGSSSPMHLSASWRSATFDRIHKLQRSCII
eukprot:scaffold143696_cov35-Tisochrysis_lutea.AAC.2